MIRASGRRGEHRRWLPRGVHRRRILRREGRWRLSIATFQGLVLGGLLFLTLTGLLTITLYTAFRNTAELLEDKSRLLMDALTTATSLYLDVTQAQVDYIAGLIEQGLLGPDDQRRMYDILAASLAATGQVHAVLFFDARGWMIIASREPDGTIRRQVESWKSNPGIVEAIADAAERESSEAFWGPPVYSDEAGTILNMRRPVRQQSFVGMVVATLKVAELSAFIASQESEEGQTAFILYDRDLVLAHRALVQDFEGLGPDRPLPMVTEVGDPVLFNIWREGWQESRLNIGTGHQADIAGNDYVFLYTALPDYADIPWLVGSYFREDDIGSQITRVGQTALVGVAGIIAFMVAAFFLGRLLRAPITQLADAATRVEALDLDRVPELPRSHLRELDDAMGAFNAMVGGLRAFALYMPRDLIGHLIARGNPAAIVSEGRTITVLFTDIVDFTARTERLSAEDTATFLNHHFALVSGCIEAEGGMIDKYIGDAAMALWNAAEDQPDHAARAVRAARSIRSALMADNAGRERPVRLRIGVHSGPAVVGNIGSVTRMNYTVVGDTVNAANRLESLGRDLLPDVEIAVLLSAATVAALPPELPVISLGDHSLRGRDAPTEVFTLAPP